MRTITKILCLLIFLVFTTKSTAQNYNNFYANINIFNSLGQNIHDFAFSYDVINGQHTCNNNFTVISKVNFNTAFNFKVFINNIDTYTGTVSLPAFGSAFFNDSFINCYSAANKIDVRVIP